MRLRPLSHHHYHLKPSPPPSTLPPLPMSFHQAATDLKLHNHCTCKRNCFNQFSIEEIESQLERAESCATRQARTEFLISQIVHETHTTMLEHLQYFVRSKPVCMTAFCDMNAVSPTKLKGVRETLREKAREYIHSIAISSTPSKIPSTHHTSQHKLQPTIAWIINWIQHHKSQIDEKHAYLVDNFTWTDVYYNTLLPEWSKSNPMIEQPSLSLFFRAKDAAIEQANVKIQRPQDHPVCGYCVEVETKMRNQQLTEEVR